MEIIMDYITKYEALKAEGAVVLSIEDEDDAAATLTCKRFDEDSGHELGQRKISIDPTSLQARRVLLLAEIKSIDLILADYQTERDKSEAGRKG